MTLNFENLDIFFNTNHFATEVTIGSSTIKGIFDNMHYGVDSPSYFEVSTSEPVLTVKSSDITTLQRGDSVTINSQAYRVHDIQPDGTGISRVLLHKS
jgi:hypothetical protein